jgi:hypothetical protein
MIAARAKGSGRAKTCPLPFSINCAGNFFEVFDRDRFEQDVVAKAWSNRHIHRNLAIS